MISFRIIIPVYNSEKWISKCLESVIKQDYKNWKAIVIDDNSTDRTLEEIKNTIQKTESRDFFRVMKRNGNVGAMENIVYGIQNICKEDEEVIVLLDGDDWLYDHNVLNHLNEVYTKENNWMTYGSLVSESGSHNGFCKPIQSTENYRRESWVTSHLRTFKYWLWKKIDDKDFRDSSYKYYSMAWDMAIMYPLIEMSGMEKVRFIERNMYVYNDTNPINDFRKNVMQQLTIANEIRNKKPYLRVEYENNKKY